MRTQFSGRTSPCQGGGRGFEPRRSLEEAGVAELADAQDLKSCDWKQSYRFDSGPRHRKEHPQLNWIEYLTTNQAVRGSTPLGCINRFDFFCICDIINLYSQKEHPQLNWIEYLTTNQAVRGSTPLGCIEKKSLRLHFFYLYGKQLSLVEYLVWDQGVAGSNPVFPISYLILDEIGVSF